MSNLPFDPERPLFPLNLPPISPKPVKPSLADLTAAVQPKPATASLPDLIIRPQVKPPSLADVIIQSKRPRIFVSYQHSSEDGSPYEVQKQFPDCEQFMKEWAEARQIMREVETKLAEQYQLVPLD